MGRDVGDSEIIITRSDEPTITCKFPNGIRWSGPGGHLLNWGVDVTNTTIFCGDHRIDFGQGYPHRLRENPGPFPQLEVSLQQIIDFWEKGYLECESDDDLYSLLEFCENKRFTFYSTIIVDIHAFKYFRYCLENEKVLSAIECPQHLGESDAAPDAAPAAALDAAAAAAPDASLLPQHLPEWIMDNIRSFLVPESEFPVLLSWDMMHDSISNPCAWEDLDHICCHKFLAVDIHICRYHFDKHDVALKKDKMLNYLYPDDTLEEKTLVNVAGYACYG